MFTSRAEHRLLLRIDNADLRLTPRGRDTGLVDDGRWDNFVARRERFDTNLRILDRTPVRAADGNRVPASQLLRQPGVTLAAVASAMESEHGASSSNSAGCNAEAAAPSAPEFSPLRVSLAQESIDVASVETTVKYAGYLRRQESEIERARKDERRRIPADFPFERVPGLSREVVQRLGQVKPDTLGQALRIPGVTPAAVAVLAAYVGRLCR